MTSSELSELTDAQLLQPPMHLLHVENDGPEGMTVTCHYCPFTAVGVTTVVDLMAIIDQHSGPIASDG